MEGEADVHAPVPVPSVSTNPVVFMAVMCWMLLSSSFDWKQIITTGMVKL
jgi:hypothetical protein